MKSLYLLMALVGAVSSATAGTITYNVNFTTDTGIAPASGTFTYDLTGNTFTSFLVSWDGITFDLKSAANSPGVGTTHCPSATATAATSFAYLTGVACGPSTWSGTELPVPPPQAAFVFGNSGINGVSIGVQSIGGTNNPSNYGSGSFTVTAATPEPTSIALVAVGGALLAWNRRRRVVPTTLQRQSRD
jgi:hypothetical protein